MRIIAIDPGYERLGIAVIEKPQKGKEQLIYSDCFKTSAKLPFYERLVAIGNEIEKLIKEFNPTAVAVETLFFASNQKTAMQVSEARGVIVYSAKKLGLEVFEYSPLQIKMAITGDGRSDKQSIIFMIPKLVKIEKEIQHDDEYDAVAVGLTCFAVNGRGLKNEL
jgi:crossover junction endodeoxyribonuclease RuvC